MRLFTHALLRKPGKSIVNALSQDQTREKPEYKKILDEYVKYADTLKKMGLELTICEADENFPDGNFVEDTYLIIGNKLIIELHPGASSREKEYSTLKPYLPKNIEVRQLSKKHTVDGGDILKDNKNIYVGLSKRTVQGAVNELQSILEPLGYQVHGVKVPDGLHLKSGMTCIQRDHFVIQESFEPILKELQAKNNKIHYFIVPKEEDYAANVLPINNKIMIPSGCAKTKEYVAKFYKLEDIYEVDTSQARLVDGALTCSSLLFRSN